MIQLLFRCPGCGNPSSASAFPLCSSCQEIPAAWPKLCRKCSSPICPQNGPDCSRPWIDFWTDCGIESFHARYLLVEPAYSFLRNWKKSGGPAFDRKVLPRDKRVFETFSKIPEISTVDALVPIPQHHFRSWRLGRSPSECIALGLARGLKKPMIPALAFDLEIPRRRRQAKLSVHERIQSRFGFTVDLELLKKRKLTNVMIVDDFMTSGRTFRAAAATLKSAGVARIQVFALGIRPRRFPSSSEDFRTRASSPAIF